MEGVYHFLYGHERDLRFHLECAVMSDVMRLEMVAVIQRWISPIKMQFTKEQ